MDPDWLAAERAYEDAVIGEDTVPQLFAASVERNGPRAAQRYKGGSYDRSLRRAGVVDAVAPGSYGELTYDELDEVVRTLAAGFADLGVEPGDRVGMFASTRMEWAQADLALLSAGAVVTTVYTESSPDQVRYLLDDPGASGVVVENAELLERVLSVGGDLDLSFIVVMDHVEGYDDREDVLTLGELHERGAAASDEAAHAERLESRGPDDLASLIYTSGTTGRPKGVELTHANFRANINQCRKRFGPRPDRDPSVPSVDESVTTLSFLPLAHVFERLSGHFLMFASGATVAYAESPDTLAEDLATVRPTVATSVPRVYERIFRTMRQQAGDGPRARIFEWAVGVAREWARADDPGPSLRARHAVADRLVYSQVRERVGGNVEFFISGGGSLSVELAELFAGMGLPILEGYGLTETAPVVSVNPPEDPRPGTLGPPVVDIETRLDTTRATPEQRAGTDNEVGELLVRGPNVFGGYWERPEATAEAFDGDGYFRTGDLVEVTEGGYLVFRERVKQLMKLTTGKYVAPGPIEDAFSTSDIVEQVMVVGDDRRMVGALIVPNPERLAALADEHDYRLPTDPEALCRDERVRGWVWEAVDAVNEGLESHETIKRFELVAEEWTAESDMLTASLKKKRRNILARHADAVERIYAE